MTKFEKRTAKLESIANNYINGNLSDAANALRNLTKAELAELIIDRDRYLAIDRDNYNSIALFNRFIINALNKVI